MPAAPASKTARGRLLRLWRRLGRLWTNEEARGDRASGECAGPQLEGLEALTPEPDWQRASARLAERLDERLGCATGAPALAVVGPPWAGACRALAGVGEARGWPVLEAPSREALLESPEALEAVAASVEAAQEPIVLCPLERFFLRHDSLMEPLRRLLAAVASRRAPVILGSDSWAWAYLCRVAGAGEITGEPLVPRPLTGEDLEAWLGAPLEARGIQLRALGGGEAVLGSAGEGSAPPAGEAAAGGPSVVLERLAAAARGNPGVAWAIWRRSLRSGGDGSLAAEAGEAGERTLWIEPHPEAAQPRLPERPAAEDLLVLHTLLLHAGLPRQLLFALLPVSIEAVAGSLQRLLRSGILEDAEGLSVSPAAYPAVRDHLAADGFLVDGF